MAVHKSIYLGFLKNKTNNTATFTKHNIRMH